MAKIDDDTFCLLGELILTEYMYLFFAIEKLVELGSIVLVPYLIPAYLVRLDQDRGSAGCMN